MTARKVCRDNNPDSTKSIKLKTKYGITLAQRDDMLVAQGSVCAICSTDTPTVKGWHVDHCHETNVVRGILCHHCNVGLGHFRDNPDTLLKAVKYLGK